MVEIVFIDVCVKMEENVIREMDIVFVWRVLPEIDVNQCVLKEHLDICVYKDVNVELRVFVIHEQVNQQSDSS